jgi:hypothetical protein
MNYFIIGATFDMIGKILIGIAVLLVHGHIIKEHKIDKRVFRAMYRKKIFVFAGIILIIIGYFFHVLSVS